MFKRTAVAAAILLATAHVASAQTKVSTFQNWSVYTGDANPGGHVCYSSSQPTEQLPEGVNRDPVYFQISNWVDRNAVNETNIFMGYPLDGNSPVTVSIDATDNFTFFGGNTTDPDSAWIRDPQQEQAMIAAMRDGITMVVTGTSQRGTTTTDTYSLRGISAALDRAATECNVAH